MPVALEGGGGSEPQPEGLPVAGTGCQCCRDCESRVSVPAIGAPTGRYYRLTGDVGLVPWTSVTGTAGYIAPEILQVRASLLEGGSRSPESYAGVFKLLPFELLLCIPASSPTGNRRAAPPLLVARRPLVRRHPPLRVPRRVLALLPLRSGTFEDGGWEGREAKREP